MKETPIIQRLASLEREIANSAADLRELRKDKKRLYKLLLYYPENTQWECPACGSTDAPDNLGEHNQECAHCGSRSIKLATQTQERA